MGVLKGAHGAGLLRHGWGLFVLSFAIGLCCLLAFSQVRAASSTRSPLNFHATVVNGDLVGSAFALSDRIVVTNAHVVEGRSPGDRVRLIPSDGSERRVLAYVVAVSRLMDLAVLKAPLGTLQPLPHDASPSRVGLRVVAAGVDASGGAQSGARLALWGAISVPRKDIDVFGPGMIADIPGVRPGFSGGPVMDGDGRLVGMLTAIRSKASSRGGRPSAGRSGGREPSLADEAYVLRATEVRAEAYRLARRAMASLR